MIVYLVTIFFIFFLCGIAQYEDTLQRNQLVASNRSHTVEARRFYFIASMILICVAGFRYKVGTDYGAYYGHYQEYAKDLVSSILSLDEPGYSLVSWIATKIYDDGATAIFLASAITIGLPLIVIYKNSTQLVFSIALFVFLGFWHGSFNGVRQYLAAAILFCGYRCLKEKKLFSYLLVVFLAFLCHRSAIVMVVLYIIVHQRVSLRNIVIIIFATVILLRAYDRIFTLANWVMDSSYSLDNVYTSTTVNSLRVLVSCSPMIVFLMYYANQVKREEDDFYLNLVIFHAVIRIITMRSALLYRIGIYTEPFQAIAIPCLLEKLPDRDSGFIKTIMIILYALYWFYEIYISGSLHNFQWIWQR